MIVELFGPSGSGKSTIAARLAAEQNLKIVRVGFGQKYPLALLFALTHPKVAARLFQLWNAKTRANNILRGKKFFRLISFLSKEQKARLSGGGVIDEGLFQFFLILHEDAIVPSEVEHCLEPLPRDGYRICIVESDPTTRFKRSEGRGKVSRHEFGEDYVKRWQDVLDTNATAMKVILTAMFAIQIIRND